MRTRGKASPPSRDQKNFAVEQAVVEILARSHHVTEFACAAGLDADPPSGFKDEHPPWWQLISSSADRERVLLGETWRVCSWARRLLGVCRCRNRIVMFLERALVREARSAAFGSGSHRLRSVQGTSRGRVAATQLYTRRPGHATPGRYPINASGQNSGSHAANDRTASNPAVIRPVLETACIDRMQSSRVNLGWIMLTSMAVISTGSTTDRDRPR